LFAVIPAKAGIHVAFASKIKMDSGFRRNDEPTPGYDEPGSPV